MSYDFCEKCRKSGPESGVAVVPCGAVDCPRTPPKWFQDFVDGIPEQPRFAIPRSGDPK